MEIPLCLNDVDSFFIGVIIHPFIGWIFTAIVVPFFIASMVVRYTTFNLEKEDCIHQLKNVLLSGTVKFNKGIKTFKPKHFLDDILDVEGKINRIMTKMVRYNNTDLGNGPSPLFIFSPTFKHISKYYENRKDLITKKNKTISEETVFDKTWGSEHPNSNQQIKYENWPVELVNTTLRLVDILEKDINPVWWWIVTGKKKNITTRRNKNGNNTKLYRFIQ